MTFDVTHDLWDEDPLPVPGTGPEHAIVVRSKMPPRPPIRRVVSSLGFKLGWTLGSVFGILCYKAVVAVRAWWRRRRAVVNSAATQQDTYRSGENFLLCPHCDTGFTCAGLGRCDTDGRHLRLAQSAPPPPGCVLGECRSPVTCYEAQVCTFRRFRPRQRPSGPGA